MTTEEGKINLEKGKADYLQSCFDSILKTSYGVSLTSFQKEQKCSIYSLQEEHGCRHESIFTKLCHKES